MNDTANPNMKVKEFTLTKRDAGGDIFEIIKGGDGKKTTVVYSRPGETPESYYQGEKIDGQDEDVR